MNHEPIMLEKSIEFLNIKANGIYVDCTLGGGGHSLKIAEKLNSKGKLISIDRDSYSIEKSKKKLKDFKQVSIIQDNFSNLEKILKTKKINLVDGILIDLGLSSFQIDDSKRGFSYNKNSKLDMRMNIDEKLNAEIIVNSYSFEKLCFIFKQYGEEYFYKNIAKTIIKYRKKKILILLLN